MDETTLETLEYPNVLKELALRAATPLGREKAEGLRPSDDIQGIEDAFAEFTEARDILKVSGKLPLGGAADIRPTLARIDTAGSYLLPEDLVQIRGTLEASIQLKSVLNPAFPRLYPKISSRIEALSDQRALYSELHRILDDKGQIKDTASTELFHIRKEIRASKERARSILEGLSADRKFSEFLQEDIITIRDDRYVLAIKAGMHTNLSGVVHGRSGSGATYFIEPLQLVELNNKVALLKKEERGEEIEVLKRATLKVAGQKEFILSDLEIIGHLDSVQAKALFAKEINAIVPAMKSEGEVRLKGARHPLLILEEIKGTARVIPIDIVIAESCRVLVISGANTGGKTVALKTLGLLTLMVQSGIPVPVEEGSEAMVFASVFSDIGDRQDIIASLSTFSAHIKRIREFLDLAGPGSLVLIDEIGAGTDPSEGGALALAALEVFREKGAVTVITTHLNVLKAHAQIDPAYMNASVEFDENTLKPLYRLRYGMPGPSLGLSIAESLGIPSELIERARGNIKEKEGAFIESIRILEEEKEEVQRLRERLSGLEKRRAEAVERLREKREAIIEKVKGRIEAEVSRAKAEIREAVEKFKEGKSGRAPSGLRAASAIEGIGSRAVNALSPRPSVHYTPSVGDKVIITGSNSKGVVLRVDSEGRKAELMAGSIKVWAPWNKLEKRGGVDKLKAAQGHSVNAGLEVSSSINIIGMRVEEALPILTRFLDNAHANGINNVEIIHGVGTGRLAKAVEEHLSADKAVKRFYHGDPLRGGAGVTIVELE